MIGSEEELKDYLDSIGVKIYDRFQKNQYSFLVYYYDNKSNTIVYRDIAPTPIASIRGFPKISETSKLPVKDFDIILYGIVDETNEAFIPTNKELDYHIYFKDEDKKDVPADSSDK